MGNHFVSRGWACAILVTFACWLPTSLAAAPVGVDLFTLGKPSASYGDPQPLWFQQTLGFHSAAGGKVIGKLFNIPTPDHPFVWSSTSPNGVDLMPPTYSSAIIYGTNGAQHVGQGGSPASAYAHAALWNGTSNTAVSLAPTGTTWGETRAVGTDGTRQVGWGSLQASNRWHALLWTGTAASRTDLHPTNLSGYDDSYALNTRGAEQVGYAQGPATLVAGSPVPHAMKWNSDSNSAVDLHPAQLIPFGESQAMGTSGTREVGYVRNGQTNQFRATLWSGTAASAIDLHPPGAMHSWAYDIDAGVEVGMATMPAPHAVAWLGTAASMIDLHNLLPPGPQFSQSQAYSIDDAGIIYGVAFDGAGRIHAVQWVGVPEPGSIFLLIASGGGLLMGRRREKNGVLSV